MAIKKELTVVHHNDIAESVLNWGSKELDLFAIIVCKIRENEGRVIFDNENINEFTQLMFDGQEVKTLADMNRKTYKEFGNLINKLHEHVIELKKSDGIRERFHLFSLVRYHDLEKKVEININNYVLPLLVKLEKHFMQYPLVEFSNLSDKMAKRLYQIGKRWCYTGEKVYNLEELKIILESGNLSNREFNRLVRRSLSEINAKTSINMQYLSTYRKDGKRVKDVKLTIQEGKPKQQKERKEIISDMKKLYKVEKIKDLTDEQKRAINLVLKDYGYSLIQIRKLKN